MPAEHMAMVPRIDALEAAHGPAFVVVGVFDGLHRGHAYLLEHLVREAAARSARPTVITFDSHPDEILTGTAPPLLMDATERLERLEGAGIAVTVVQQFDVALRMTPFDEFVRQIADRVALRGFLMTPDAAFGHERGGTVETVTALGQGMGFDVAVVPPFELDGRPVRSSDIRAAIASGDLALAERLLGRPYGVVGHVENGRLTFPVPVALPPVGTYRVSADGAATTISVASDGSIELATPHPTSGTRLRVTFAAA